MIESIKLRNKNDKSYFNGNLTEGFYMLQNRNLHR